MKRILCATILTLMTGLPPAVAKTVEYLEVQSRVEGYLVQHYQRLIGTRLREDQYSVSARVGLSKIKTPVKKDGPANAGTKAPGRSPDSLPEQLPPKRNDENRLPGDMTLGLIDAIDLLERQQRRIASLEQENENAGQWPSSIQVVLPESDRFSWEKELRNYRLNRVEVFVGVSPDLSPNYNREFAGWLKSAVANDFGRLGRSSLFTLPAKPKTETGPQQLVIQGLDEFGRNLATALKKDEVQVKQEDEWSLKSMQFLVGIIVLALTLFAVGVLWAVFLRPKSGEREGGFAAVPMMPQPQSSGETKKASKQGGRKAAPAPVWNENVSIALAETESKIEKALAGIQTHLKSLVRQWMREGESGCLKVVCLLDKLSKYSSEVLHEVSSVLSEEEKSLVMSGFDRVSALNPGEKLKVLSRVYWDLVAVKTMGSVGELLRLENLAQMDVSQFHEILRGKESDLQAFGFLYLAPERQDEFLQTLEANQRQQLIGRIADLAQAPSEKIQFLERNLKEAMQRTRSESGRTVSGKVLNFLKSMRLIDELKFLPALAARLGTGGVERVLGRPSLAFAGNWSKSVIARVFRNVDAQAVATFVLLKPDCEELVFAVCSKDFAEWVRDEMKRVDAGDADFCESKLRILQKKLEDHVARGDLKFSDVFPRDPEMRHAA